MKESAIELMQTIFQYGDLHDCRLIGFIYNAIEGMVRINVGDIHVNNKGTALYKGYMDGLITFSGVSYLNSTDINSDERPRIFDFVISELDTRLCECIIRCFPRGIITFSFIDSILSTEFDSI